MLVVAGVGGQRPGRRRVRDDPADAAGLAHPAHGGVEARLEVPEPVQRLQPEELVEHPVGDDPCHGA
jgi:hypothetical protein